MIATLPPVSVTVTVTAGQTLSQIAASHGVSLRSIEAANPSVTDPNSIYVGERLHIGATPTDGAYVETCQVTVSHGQLYANDCQLAATASPSSLPVKPTHAIPVTGKGAATPSAGGTQEPSSDRQAGPTGEGWVPAPPMPDSFSRCVEMRESSDNPASINQIPGYQGNGGGLFGDLKSTWADYGGYAQPFQAPVSVQVAFNARLFAEDGTSPWLADGCQIDGSVKS